MNALSQLSKLVPPPEKASFSAGDWAKVEAQLGRALPSDYKELIGLYGSGIFCSLIDIINPLENDNDALSPWMSAINLLQAWKKTDPNGCQYSLFPDSPGLLPCGSYGDVNLISWYTTGEPNDWSIVYFGRGFGCHLLDRVSLTQFLVDFLEGRSPLVPSIMGQVGKVPRVFKPFRPD